MKTEVLIQCAYSATNPEGSPGALGSPGVNTVNSVNTYGREMRYSIYVSLYLAHVSTRNPGRGRSLKVASPKVSNLSWTRSAYNIIQHCRN